jgi:hypothetical protein
MTRSIDPRDEHRDAGSEHSSLRTDSMKRSQNVMMTRRNLVSKVALGAASFAAASQFMSVRALAADGPRDDTNDDNTRSERREDRRERRQERRQEQKDQEQNQNN